MKISLHASIELTVLVAVPSPFSGSVPTRVVLYLHAHPLSASCFLLAHDPCVFPSPIVALPFFHLSLLPPHTRSTPSLFVSLLCCSHIPSTSLFVHAPSFLSIIALQSCWCLQYAGCVSWVWFGFHLLVSTWHLDFHSHGCQPMVHHDSSRNQTRDKTTVVLRHGATTAATAAFHRRR